MNRLDAKRNTNETTPDSMVSLYFAHTNPNAVNPSGKDENPMHWFPMRITYHREMRIKALLDEMGVENFLPMQWEMVESYSQ